MAPLLDIADLAVEFATPDGVVRAVNGVSLTVALPDGVELTEYRGLDEVSWTTRLQAGKNVLPLQLVAIGGSGGELVARLQHEGDEKVFTVNVAVI